LVEFPLVIENRSVGDGSGVGPSVFPTGFGHRRKSVTNVGNGFPSDHDAGPRIQQRWWPGARVSHFSTNGNYVHKTTTLWFLMTTDLAISHPIVWGEITGVVWKPERFFNAGVRYSCPHSTLSSSCAQPAAPGIVAPL
jgi:hypothetical protein